MKKKGGNRQLKELDYPIKKKLKHSQERKTAKIWEHKGNGDERKSME